MAEDEMVIDAINVGMGLGRFKETVKDNGG